MAYAYNNNKKDKVTKLVTRRISGLHDAAAEFGEAVETYEGKETPMVLIPSRSACIPWLTIPEGMHAVVQRNGKYVGIWGPGLHFAAPWVRVSHLVTKQYILFDTPVKECPTLDNVFVEIDISVMVHVKDTPEDVYNFVYGLGPERLEAMLKAYQEEAVRTMARKKTYQKIYDLMDTEDFFGKNDDDSDDDEKATNKSTNLKEIVVSSGEANTTATTTPLPNEVEMTSIADAPAMDEKHVDIDHHEQLENTKKSMNERLNQYGIEVTNITITNVRLPKQFADEMELATTFKSKNLYQNIEQRYRMTTIGDDEKQLQLKQKLTEDRKSKDVQAEQLQAEERKSIRLIEAETEKVLAQIEEKHKAEVRTLETSSQLKVAQVEKEAEVKKATIMAQATADAVAIKAETIAFQEKTRAKTQLTVAQNEAKALLLQANAEKIASQKLRSKREFESRLARIKVLEQLALNKQLVLSGTNQDSVLAQMLAAQTGAKLIGLAPSSSP